MPITRGDTASTILCPYRGISGGRKRTRVRLDPLAQREDLKPQYQTKKQAAEQWVQLSKNFCKKQEKVSVCVHICKLWFGIFKRTKSYIQNGSYWLLGGFEWIGERLIFYFTKCLYCFIIHYSKCYFVTETKSNKINSMT